MTEKILKTAELLQKEAHSYAVNLVSSKVSYQDAINTWLFLKLATIMHANENVTIVKKEQEDIEYKPGYDPD
jgi:hypothetical protein